MSTPASVSVGPATDPERFLATDLTVWFGEVDPAPAEQQLVGLPGRFAAEVEGADPTTYAGVYGVFPMTLRVPGPAAGLRTVPVAGLTFVGVHPDQRRRGVLTAMIRHHLEQVRDQPGTHLSVLHASEPAIYGRYGYGLASLELDVELGRGATLTAPGLDVATEAVTTRLGTITDPGMPQRLLDCHSRAAGLGAVVGELGYYERICWEPAATVRDKESWRVLFARRDGEDVGFAAFRRQEKWEKGRPAGTMDVWVVVGEPVVRLVLLRRLVDFDLIGSVNVRKVAPDDPLFTWVGGPRAASAVETYDSLWVRLVDLPEALSARAWCAPCDVVLAVEDTAAPWNHGTWRVHADADGTAEVERTDREPDVTLPVAALGAAYLGAPHLLVQQQAGLVTEHRPGATAELAGALRTPLGPSAAVGF